MAKLRAFYKKSVKVSGCRVVARKWVYRSLKKPKNLFFSIQYKNSYKKKVNQIFPEESHAYIQSSPFLFSMPLCLCFLH